MDWSRSVHGLGDLHAGGIRRARVQTMLDDVATLPQPALHLQIGDATEHGIPAEDEMARRWLGRLPASCHTILGNHDIYHDKRTPRDWAWAYGYASQNHAIELPFVRMLAVGPDRDLPGNESGILSRSTLAWLDRELGRTAKDCWIACHWPLYRTVLGDSRKVFTSAMRSFHAKPDARIRAVLARHRNVKAWLSEHTHSPLGAPGLVTRARLAEGRSILAVNLSGLVAVGKRREPTDPIRSVYLTHLPGRIEVRFRDHGARDWIAVGGRRVVSVRV